MTLSTSQPTWPLNGQQPELLFSELTHLGLISVTGEQGRSFIHGQVTTDISSLEQDQWRWGAHCDPKGKMLASFRTFAKDGTLFLMMPKDTLALDLPQLQKYAVFSKAELTDVTADWLLLGVAGEQATTWLTAQFGELNHELTLIDGGMIIHDAGRYIVAIEQGQAASLISAIEQPIYDATAWQALEIAAGYPNLGANHQGQFVPQMCNVQAINGISFNKGCYMGQETIARMKYRGGNKRALYIVSGSVSTPLTNDSQLEIALEDGEGFRRAGTIIEAVQRDGLVLLTAVLANDTQLDAKLRVADDDQSELTLIALPYSLEEQE
ncbi:tRNA-modifying protein YgfZ [Shewanella schlegeliana]|uniref:tRNA-modifying protein YgfZ n=1 Tax=Shewanella schlegeliana TaxID=190308 RepID=A0ABS1SVI7_9GAMM|nr:tRNA-modifying protein YgfZ [Shewanella schlegeliana]MBL4912539.1 tRNA-modifying protein YgfZ [Shewanella schlegeliana]MCL1107991.1 tRNA-modifying protein YgfZ [Shewanella schlegeliana]GIU21321.1 tRNA-modifying protein YgfZ [Shewanella schlegeliana]